MSVIFTLPRSAALRRWKVPRKPTAERPVSDARKERRDWGIIERGGVGGWRPGAAADWNLKADGNSGRTIPEVTTKARRTKLRQGWKSKIENRKSNHASASGRIGEPVPPTIFKGAADLPLVKDRTGRVDEPHPGTHFGEARLVRAHDVGTVIRTESCTAAWSKPCYRQA